ncbi:hypothetical protein MKQ68_24500 [Chitinophaga horti]|uniref:HEPN domain-containing protein n=1 Tax=Chitinophaga horti TaxID=2920382 RepID=A0ABY6J0Q0_9BACT|nr:hypothetical protein [Chitinophaga horti]UYQ93248.1 hypothetical protein MKQ68_24500 [Chitinophaga horti]
MKILKLHPLMTISLLQMQFQRLLNCNVTVYIKHSLANAFDTLKEAGLDDDQMIEHPIDETLSLREFEEELEDKYNFCLEICRMDQKPFMNKSLRLFQLGESKVNTNVSPDLLAQQMNNMYPGRSASL